MRRVVTGQTDRGKSVFVSNEEIEPVTFSVMPGYAFFPAWGADEAITLPNDGTPTAQATYFPPVGGFRFSFVTLPPETVTPGPDVDLQEAMTEVREKLPGMIEHIEPEHPGMHTTDTVDFDVVMSGEIWLELDDGAEEQLKAGECVVMNGTRHAWHNRSAEPCTLMSVLVGAQRTR